MSHYRLARIEPNGHEQMAIHLVPLGNESAFCGVRIQVRTWEVEWLSDSFPTLRAYMIARYMWKVEAPSCERCCRALNFYFENLLGGL